MATKADFPLTLSIKALNGVAGPLREINAQIQRVAGPTQHLGEKVKGVFDNVKELGKQFLEMEVIGAFALFELVKHTVEAGAELEHMAERTGLSVDAFAALRFAAGQAGVEQEEFNGAMDQFNKRLGEARAGTGPLLEFLNKVSPALAQQVIHAKNNEEAIGLMADAFKKLKDPAKIAALTAEAFGRGSKQFGMFLHQGSEKIKEQAGKYTQLAGSQEEFAKRAEDTEKAFKEVGAAFDGLRASAAEGLLPAISELARSLAGFLADNRDGLKKWATEAGQAITDWVKGGGLERLVQNIKDLAVSVRDAIEGLGGFKVVLGGIALIMAGPLIGSVLDLGKAIWTLGSSTLLPVIGFLGDFVLGLRAGYGAMQALNLAVVANPLGAFILLLSSVALVGYEIYKNFTPLKELFQDIWHNVEQITLAMMGFKHGPLRNLLGEYDAAPAFKGLPASSLRNAPNPSGAQDSEAHVTVDFVNAPKGTRVTADPTSTTPLDIALVGATNQ